MSFHNNPIEQRKFYKKRRQAYNNNMPRLRHCHNCGDREHLEDSVEENGKWYCSIKCLNEAIQ